MVLLLQEIGLLLGDKFKTMIEVKSYVADLVRDMEDDDEKGNTKISKYVIYNQRELVETVDAYVNSKHLSGETDSMGREKPFFNIVTAVLNVWYRATDIDRKNISFRATKPGHIVLAFCASLLLQTWMRKSFFGQFLNNWGRELCKYGSAVSKHVEKDGELISEVIPWNRLICDPVDFNNNAVIEVLWLTEAQLRAKIKNGYNKAMVDSMIDSKEARKTMDGQKKDTKDDYYQVYEVHGELPLSLITKDEDDDEEYTQQMHAISYNAIKNPNKGESEYDNYTLYKGKEEKSPYQIDHLIKEDGRTISIGAVEGSFQAQWMMNHNVKSIKDQLDLASKLIFQTSDGNFVGQNVLSAVETGAILIHGDNQPLTSVANNSHDITSLQAYGQQWKQLVNEIGGIAESMVTQAKSGTAWRQTQAELQEAHSLFELMKENKGLGIEMMMRNFVIPSIKKELDTTEEISEILSEHQIKKIDSIFVPYKAIEEANKIVIDDILNKTPEDIRNGNLFTPEMQEEVIASTGNAVQENLNKLGNQRFIKPSEIKDKTWKEALKDFEWELEVDVTGESKDKQAVLATLSTVLQTIGSNPMLLQDPKAKLIFNKILSETNAISEMEIMDTENEPQPQPQPQPQPAPIT